MRRSVAALWLCSAVAAAQDDFDARVAAALERARPALLQELRRADGGELALLCLAAANDGVPPSNRVFATALSKLSRTTLRDTYGLSIRLMVLAHVEDFPARDDAARRDTLLLLENQSARGGFSYSAKPSHDDLSNTQYAALGLRASIHIGVAVPIRVWSALAESTLGNQAQDGGFCYSGDNGPTMSMTTAGIAILELCRQQFERNGLKTGDLERGVDDGWRWMDAHPETIGALGSWHGLYAHYGLERACVLSTRTEVGGEDWYRKGAEPMLRLQRPNGGFPTPTSPQSGTSAVDTAFAILFLRRSFQRELAPRGPTTPGPTRLCHQLPSDADDDAIRRAVECDVERGDAAVPDLLRSLRDPIGARRRAAAHALLRISGVDFRYHPARSDEQNADAIRRAEDWWAERRRRDAGR